MRLLEFFIPLVLLAFSALLLSQGWQEYRRSAELVAHTELTQGTIVKMAPYLGGKLGKGSALVYFPVVRFTTADGREIRFEHQQSRRADHYRPGDPVPVRYYPEQPEHATLAGFNELWSLAVVYGAGGLLLLLFGGWFLRRALKKGRP